MEISSQPQNNNNKIYKISISLSIAPHPSLSLPYSLLINTTRFLNIINKFSSPILTRIVKRFHQFDLTFKYLIF